MADMILCPYCGENITSTIIDDELYHAATASDVYTHAGATCPECHGKIDVHVDWSLSVTKAKS